MKMNNLRPWELLAARTERAVLLWLTICCQFCIHSADACAQTSTATTLEMKAGGEQVNMVGRKTVVKLTAAVTSGAQPVSVGQVKFCDADARFCEDSHLLGISQLTKSGTAEMGFIPPVGNHAYRAIFLGTTKSASSASYPLTLDVQGAYPTITTISSTGSAGSYTLGSTVSAIDSQQPPLGSVRFVDQSDQAQWIATGGLVARAPELSWT